MALVTIGSTYLSSEDAARASYDAAQASQLARMRPPPGTRMNEGEWNALLAPSADPAVDDEAAARRRTMMIAAGVAGVLVIGVAVVAMRRKRRGG